MLPPNFMFLDPLFQGLYALLGKTPFAKVWVTDRVDKHLLSHDSLRSNEPQFFLSSALINSAYEEALTVNVNPKSIQSWLPSSYEKASGIFSFRDYFLVNGQITDKVLPLNRHGLHNEAVELTRFRHDFRTMPSYQRLQKKIDGQQGKYKHNKVEMTDTTVLDSYFNRYLALLNSIEEHGLLPRAQLKKQGPKLNDFGVRTRYLEIREANVGIMINEAGKLFRFRGGFHRFAFCQQLELASIPVTVKLIHIDWLKQFSHEASDIDSLLRRSIAAALKQ